MSLFPITRLRHVCRLALAAMLAFALLPSVSHALAAARGQSSWLLACTQQGVQLLDAAQRDDGAPAAQALQHCAYCALGQGGMGMPPAAGLSVAQLSGDAAPPSVPRPAARAAPLRRDALARAPPPFC